MTITTSAGRSYEAAYMYNRDKCLLLLTDDHRLLSQIAAEFEGLDWIESDSGVRVDDCGELMNISRMHGSVSLSLGAAP